MVGASSQESLAEFKKVEVEYETSRQSKQFDPKGDYYWIVHPKPKACEKCKAMEGKEFMEKPERPHPNCKCEIKKHPLRKPKRYINGSLTGYEWYSFNGGRQINIEFRGISGGITSGVLVKSNHIDSKVVACPPLTTPSVSLITDQSPLVDWQITLIATGSDNIQIEYTIIYEK